MNSLPHINLDAHNAEQLQQYQEEQDRERCPNCGELLSAKELKDGICYRCYKEGD